MEGTITNGQTCLEKRGIEARSTQTNRSEYNVNNQYGPTHKNAKSDGDVKGKGVGGSHGHWLPNCNADTHMIKYDNFSTNPADNIGGEYDIEGRNGIGGRKAALASSLYNYLEPYSPNLIDTSKNQAEGQYVVK